MSGISSRVLLELDQGSVQKMMSDYERALATSGQKGAKAMLRALREELDVKLASLNKLLADGLIDEKTFAKMKREAESGFTKTLSKGMEQLRVQGKLTDAEFTKLAKSLKQVKQESDATGGSFKSMLAGVTAGITASITSGLQNLAARGLAAVRDYLFDSSRAAAESETAFDRLAGQLERVGVRVDSVRGRLEANARALQATSRFDDDAYFEALDKLIEGTDDYNLSLQNMQVVADLAAKRHMSLAEAAEIVGKALRDPEMSLTRFNVKVREGETAIQALARTFRGEAARDAQTFAGQVARAGNAWDNLKESFGAAINDFITRSGVFPEVTTYLQNTADQAAEWWKQNDDQVKEAIRDARIFLQALITIARYYIAPITLTIRVTDGLTSWWNGLSPTLRSMITLPGRVANQYVTGGAGPVRGAAPTPALPTAHATPPAQHSAGQQSAGDARMTPEQIARWKDIAALRHLTATETAALRREEAALNTQLRETRAGTDDEVRVRQRLHDVTTALQNRIAGTRQSHRDAQRDEIDGLLEIGRTRDYTRTQTERLVQLEEELTSSINSGAVSAKAEGEALEKLGRVRQAMDAPMDRMIDQMRERVRLSEELAETDVQAAAQVALRAGDIADLLQAEDQLRRALSARNLERTREIELLRRLGEVQRMLPQVNLTMAATVVDRPEPRVRNVGETEEDTKRLQVLRAQVSLLSEISRYRALSTEEVREAEEYEADIERRLQNQNLTRRDRLQLEQDLREVRDITSDIFNMDNVWEAFTRGAAVAGETAADSLGQAFQQLFEDGLNMKRFLDTLWDGVGKGAARAVAAEAKAEAGRAGAKAAGAAADALFALARHDYKAAGLYAKSIPQYLLSMAKWAALGGAMGALGSSGGGGSGGGGDSRDPRSGPDAGQEHGRKAETHLYVRLDAKVDPFDPHKPQIQDRIVQAVSLGVDRHGPGVLNGK